MVISIVTIYLPSISFYFDTFWKFGVQIKLFLIFIDFSFLLILYKTSSNMPYFLINFPFNIILILQFNFITWRVFFFTVTFWTNKWYVVEWVEKLVYLPVSLSWNSSIVNFIFVYDQFWSKLRIWKFESLGHYMLIMIGHLNWWVACSNA